MNLGRAWYGPAQYLELLKQHAPRIGARYAVVCLSDGNDVQDVEEYDKWLQGGTYYHFALSRKSFLRRYLTAVRDTFEASAAFIEGRFTQTRLESTPSPQSATPHPDLGIIRLKDRSLAMRFGYWNRSVIAGDLLASATWGRMRAILAEMALVAKKNGTTLVLVFAPTKLEVYGSHFEPSSGSEFLSKIVDQLRFQDEQFEAFRDTSTELDIPFVDLLPAFRELAREGELLYYPFDSHWNARAREVAAKLIAEKLSQLSDDGTTSLPGS